VNCRGAFASGHLRIDLLQSIHAVVNNYATHSIQRFASGPASTLGPVCTENLNPEVVVMESAEDGERF